MSEDLVVLNEWHPVAYGDQLASGALMPVRLLDEQLVLWRETDGTAHAWDDRCPHRGAAFTLGEVVKDQLQCPYHGWRFDGTGRCTLRPAQPNASLPPQPMTDSFHVRERYGIVWVCLGTPGSDVVPFDEFADERLRNINAGPYRVKACAPRIVENFIDMAHFAFVHEGTLGDESSTEVPPYEVESFVDATGRSGVRVVDMRVMQPKANLQAAGPADVIYSYRISRPLCAILTKRVEGSEIAEAITLFIQPLSEEDSQVWMIFSALRSPESDEAIRDFQDGVFAQDGPILESQRPKRLPLEPRAELAQKADAFSAAYRRYLRDMKLGYGVV